MWAGIQDAELGGAPAGRGSCGVCSPLVCGRSRVGICPRGALVKGI